MMTRVISTDGTAIAFDQAGAGPPVILIAGAFCSRSTTAPLAAALLDRFTTLNVDRRGRGDSGDTDPYAVEREIEDLNRLIAHAGGSAAVFGHSSGATLVLRAAAHGLAITALLLYEPPFLVDGSREPLRPDFADRLASLVATGRRGDAVELYQIEGVGIPADHVASMRDAPFRPALEAIAHTLAYDAQVVGDLTFPTELIGAIQAPTLVIDGENSPPLLRTAAAALAATLPNGHRQTLPGQTHDISHEPTAAAIAQFLDSVTGARPVTR
jgi:pimeloyl-ACP methyl ester carboxylesterase